jgi:hypothetical protein
MVFGAAPQRLALAATALVERLKIEVSRTTFSLSPCRAIEP